jgi:hypothetical protein
MMQDNRSYVKFEQPLRGDVSCRHCGGEIEAIAETHSGFAAIVGIRSFTWRHVKTGSGVCTQSFEADPYDGWEATRRIETALKGNKT